MRTTRCKRYSLHGGRFLIALSVLSLKGCSSGKVAISPYLSIID
ncbi:MAG: hypothetical protein U0L35_06790 [Methanobrevibacter sp.]|nr:hypothetical protein [Methanobrevibacter sp.]